MNIKILVCYHKKDKLFKNDVLVPIHCGRAVAKEKHKDGKISEEDYNWLINNMIGDDTGDNISHLNREINEASAIYWAWKNYDKLGNPDYIGLCHYRRLFNFSKNQNVLLSKRGIIRKLHNNTKSISEILKNYDFIVRTPVFAYDLILQNLDSFQTIAKFSKNYHPKMYFAVQKLKKDKQYYCNNMFVMSREDFFEYCNEIFPIMFDFINNEKRCDLFLENTQKIISSEVLKQFNGGRDWLPRLTGFFMEYLSGLYFLDMMKTKTHAECECVNIEEHTKILKYIFSITNKKYNDVEYRVMFLFGYVIKIKEVKR